MLRRHAPGDAGPHLAGGPRGSRAGAGPPPRRARLPGDVPAGFGCVRDPRRGRARRPSFAGKLRAVAGRVAAAARSGRALVGMIEYVPRGPRTSGTDWSTPRFGNVSKPTRKG